MRLVDGDIRDRKNEIESSFLASAVGEILIFVHMVNPAEKIRCMLRVKPTV
jgi:hypothetical protein